MKINWSSALVGQLGRAPDDAVHLVMGSIPGHDLCERNTFGGAQKTELWVMEFAS